ncbi:hypothetical protein AVDCRST_MAG84-2516 [uncultured Microcoleus sp.]|uniref:Uncharacterized protein n=1 Tax=uncultured Microcoleus sp. TaxID=259945 RepID=A0A6J4LW77_9CYAN|nr:hypothetical protein AVDCRST_MAG84-2516 [uncultured Microcoleus sp.]
MKKHQLTSLTYSNPRGSISKSVRLIRQASSGVPRPTGLIEPN